MGKCNRCQGDAVTYFCDKCKEFFRTWGDSSPVLQKAKAKEEAKSLQITRGGVNEEKVGV